MLKGEGEWGYPPYLRQPENMSNSVAQSIPNPRGINRDYTIVHLHSDYERVDADKWYKIFANSEFRIHDSES